MDDKMMRAVETTEGSWHGNGSCNIFLVGGGYLCKPHYGEYGDHSGHFVSGFSLHYYGVECGYYPLDRSYDAKEYLCGTLLKKLNEELPDDAANN